jgi:hypothetical protein
MAELDIGGIRHEVDTNGVDGTGTLCPLSIPAILRPPISIGGRGCNSRYSMLINSRIFSMDFSPTPLTLSKSLADLNCPFSVR